MAEPSTRQHRTEKARAAKAAKRAAKLLELYPPKVTELASAPDLPSDS